MVTQTDEIQTISYMLASSFNPREQEILTSILEKLKGEQPMKFYSAQEARARTDDARKKLAEEIEQKIQCAIEDAIAHGEDRIIFEGQIPPLTIARLREVDYLVDECHDSYNNKFYRIVWGV